MTLADQVLSSLSEATPDQDAEYRAIVDHAINTLIKRVSKSFKSIAHPTRERDGMGVYARELGPRFAKAYPKLLFLFTKEQRGTNGWTAVNTQGDILVTVAGLPDNFDYDQRNKAKQAVLNTIQKNRSTLFHELIHYLDSQRWTGPFWKELSPGEEVHNSTGKTIAQYLSDPREYNAWTQTALKNAQDLLDRIDPSVYLTAPFSRLYDAVLKEIYKFHPELKVLKGKWDQKFKKRFYQFLQDYLSKQESHQSLADQVLSHISESRVA